MDENAQLRAEKMILASKTMIVSTTSASVSAFAYLGNGSDEQQLRSDELSLYSTIKNTKKTQSGEDKQQATKSLADFASYMFDDQATSNNTNFYDDNR